MFTNVNPKRRQIFVVAGNHREFTDVIKRKQDEFFSDPKKVYVVHVEPFPDYIFVSNVEILRGRSTIEGFYYGSYSTRHDIKEIQFTIKMIKAKMNSYGNN